MLAGALGVGAVMAGCGPSPKESSGRNNAPPAPISSKKSPPAPEPDPAEAAPSNGFGDQIDWREHDAGLRDAVANHRPVMIVIHAPWCPRCRELQQSFFDPRLVAASKDFVMVNIDQDETPSALRYAPDGQYVPRVVFLDPLGRIDPSLQNPQRTRYKYFFMPHDDLVGAMHRALERHGQTTTHP